MHIRQAEHDDLSELVEGARKFYATTHYRQFCGFDDESVRRLGRMMIDSGVFLVAETQGQIVGMVGLVVVPWMFNSNVKTAHEVVWWVDPEVQGHGIGKHLLAAVEPACRARGAVCIQMIHLANSPPQAAALYDRMGYVFSESSFSKGAPWA
ncbi:MAG: GNAT family N-acetyltransferase [Flavobacteriales bacterium]|nr:GNAT family N-acetyltransferase [Flavobacteriales bacterium]